MASYTPLAAAQDSYPLSSFQVPHGRYDGSEFGTRPHLDHGHSGDDIGIQQSYSTYDHNPLLTKSLGQEISKSIISAADLTSFIISLMAMALAVATVGADHMAWRLGYVLQIVVIGFLLSIMNFCLTNVLPTFFMRCEARLGNSQLQNYEGLLRNKPFGSRVSPLWRVTLFIVLAFPLVLSVLYKLFTGGEAVLPILQSHGLYNESFGMYAPPGMLPLGWNSGTLLMYNATTPFLQGSTNQSAVGGPAYGDPANDLPLPKFPQVYGFNTLLLSETASAMLDAPPSDWITQVQAALEPGETWNVSGTVLASVASVNDSIEPHRHESISSTTSGFWTYYGANGDGGTGPVGLPLFDGWSLQFLENQAASNHDESWCFVALVPDDSTFEESATMFSITRQYCRGTWSITVGDVRLIDGHCNHTIGDPGLSAHPQEIFENNILALQQYYVPVLVEFLAPFTPLRNQSHWLNPTMTAVVASMYWSRVAAMDGPGGPHYPGDNSFGYAGIESQVYDAGLFYQSVANITSGRTAVRKDPGLYAILALQPLLTLIAILGSSVLYHVPIGRGFGTVAILAGVKIESLAVLEGAGFSGQLERPAHLGMEVQQFDGGKSKVVYTVDEEKHLHGGRIRRHGVYR